MSLPGPRFTYEDYKLLPEDKRFEMIEGELLVTPAPSTRHQMILVRILVRLVNFVTAGRLGQVLPSPTDVILSDDTVVQPDILFISRERLAIMDPKGGVRGAPDLVVEVLSPSTAGRDRILKRKLYAKYGVKEYWIVDPDACSIEVLIYSPGGMELWQAFLAGSSLTSPLMDGLTVSLDDLFSE